MVAHDSRNFNWTFWRTEGDYYYSYYCYYRSVEIKLFIVSATIIVKPIQSLLLI